MPAGGPFHPVPLCSFVEMVSMTFQRGSTTKTSFTKYPDPHPSVFTQLRQAQLAPSSAQCIQRGDPREPDHQRSHQGRGGTEQLPTPTPRGQEPRFQCTRQHRSLCQLLERFGFPGGAALPPTVKLNKHVRRLELSIVPSTPARGATGAD